MSQLKVEPFTPRRAASWWSVAEDLLWPEKKVKDKIQRRTDALAAAHVDTVIQFGFHCRFDFAWNFGATPVSSRESWVVVSEWMQNKDAGRNLDAIEKYGADNAFFISKITAAGAAAPVEPGRRWRNP